MKSRDGRSFSNYLVISEFECKRAEGNRSFFPISVTVRLDTRNERVRVGRTRKEETTEKGNGRERERKREFGEWNERGRGTENERRRPAVGSGPRGRIITPLRMESRRREVRGERRSSTLSRAPRRRGPQTPRGPDTRNFVV